jgi:hypothetical protein
MSAASSRSLIVGEVEQSEMTKRHTDEKHDQTSEDSFPASDPPASTGITGPRADDPDRARRGSKGGPSDPGPRRDDASPTHERPTEAAYQSEREKRPRQSSN